MFGSRTKELEHKLDLIYTALVVRDPGTSMAAEAFEGLRKQVIAGATARHAHVAQLAEFDVALRRGASADDLMKLTSQWLDQAGVVRVDDPAQRDAFESTVRPGVPVEVDIPAYLNTVTGQLVRQGRLRERKNPAVWQPTAVEEDSAPATLGGAEGVNELVGTPPNQTPGENARAGAPEAGAEATGTTTEATGVK